MAGAGFKTFNTGDVLTASDVNTYLMQQTVMVFDDASARSTALPTPSEGMFSYLKDTNLTYRYDGSAWLSDAGTTSPLTTKGDVWGYSTADARVPVGANGTVLTADSAEALGVKWAAASSGALVKINTTSFTAVNTIAVDNVFTSTYDNYLLLVVGGGTTANQPTLELQFRASGVATATNYKTQEIYSTSTTLASRSNLYGTTKFFLGEMTNSVDEAASFAYNIFSPYLTDRTNIMGSGIKMDGPLIRFTSGGLNDSTSYDGFEIDFDYTATGILTVYGYAK